MGHKLTITLETESDAFAYDESAEIARILRQFANRTTETGTINSGQKLLDINGNTVGEVQIHEVVETKQEAQS